MKNSMEMITVIHALSYVGAVAVLLNTRLSREELLWQMDDAEVVCLVTDQDFDAKDVPVYSLAEVMNGPKEEASIQEEFSLEEAMTIIYTSGTTGKPKGVILTYGNHWASAVGSSLNLGLRDDDCWLACMPMFHVGGLSLLMKTLCMACVFYLFRNMMLILFIKHFKREE